MIPCIQSACYDCLKSQAAAAGVDQTKSEWCSQASPAPYVMLCKESASASSSLASNQSVLLREGSLDDTASAGLCQQAAHAAAAAEHAHRLPADEIEERLHELLMEEAEDQAQHVTQKDDGRPILAGSERANLVNWMTSTSNQLALGMDTLFIAVRCLDQLRMAPGSPHALVYGAACLWVAAKWTHGPRAPSSSMVASVLPPCGCGKCAGCLSTGAGRGTCGVVFAQRRLVQAEGQVLRALDYGARVLRYPTVETFLRPALLHLHQQHEQQQVQGQPPQPPRHQDARSTAVLDSQHAGSPHTLLSLCSLLAEESLLECQLLVFRPSIVAAACVAYAHALTGRPLRESDLALATGSTGAEALAATSKAAHVLRAVHAAVSAAAVAGNPYATSLRWLRLDASALLVPPIASAGDGRLVQLAAGLKQQQQPRAVADWRWVLPDCRARAA